MRTLCVSYCSALITGIVIFIIICVGNDRELILCYKHFLTGRAALTFCKSCLCTGRLYRIVDDLGVSFFSNIYGFKMFAVVTLPANNTLFGTSRCNNFLPTAKDMSRCVGLSCLKIVAVFAISAFAAALGTGRRLNFCPLSKFMSVCFNGSLCHKHFVTNRAMLSLGKTCFSTSRLYRIVDDLGVSCCFNSRLRHKHLATHRAVRSRRQACFCTGWLHGFVNYGGVSIDLYYLLRNNDLVTYRAVYALGKSDLCTGRLYRSVDDLGVSRGVHILSLPYTTIGTESVSKAPFGTGRRLRYYPFTVVVIIRAFIILGFGIVKVTEAIIKIAVKARALRCFLWRIILISAGCEQQKNAQESYPYIIPFYVHSILPKSFFDHA